MIFVTTGTTLAFDELIRAVDSLINAGRIIDKVICQIGNGTYLPSHCEYFRFKPDITPWVDESSIVICHGGTGTVLSLIHKKKKFVAVANPKSADNHQRQFLRRLSEETDIVWTEQLEDLPGLIRRAMSVKIELDHSESLIAELKSYLDSLVE